LTTRRSRIELYPARGGPAIQPPTLGISGVTIFLASRQWVSSKYDDYCNISLTILVIDHHHLSPVTEGPGPLSPASPTLRNFPRSRTVEFRDDSDSLRLRRTRTHNVDPGPLFYFLTPPRSNALTSSLADFPGRRPSHANLRDLNNRTLTRTGTYQPDVALNIGFGGFPNPIVAAAGFARRRIPALDHVVERNLTLPRTTTFASTHSVGNSAADPRIKPVSYISFDAVVGRNSKFHGLTTAQEEELGGVEYRVRLFNFPTGTLISAADSLVPAGPRLALADCHWLLGTVTTHRRPRLGPLAQQFGNLPACLRRPCLEGQPDVVRVLPGMVGVQQQRDEVRWFSSGISSARLLADSALLSLVDASMVPFARAYWLIIVMGILILGGNTAYPVFLRLCMFVLRFAVRLINIFTDSDSNAQLDAL
jgi:hypothetical protein